MTYSFKFLKIIIVVLYLVIAGLFLLFARELALKDAKQEASILLDNMNAIRNYVSIVQRPLIDELKEQGVLEKDFFDVRLHSSSYISREIYNLQSSDRKDHYEYKLVALEPLNPEHLATDFEKSIIKSFQNKKYNEYSQVVNEKDGSYIFVSIPIYINNNSCYECHSSSAPPSIQKNYANMKDFIDTKGDIVAMISFRVPIKSILTNHLRELIVGTVVLFIVFLIFSFIIYKLHQTDLKYQEKADLLMLSHSRLATMGEMIGNISHQWRQPLAQVGAILINIELYSERGRLTHEKLSQKITDANEQLNFMSDTINDFKNFFSPKSYKDTYQVQDVIVRANRLLSASLQKHAIQVDIKIDENFTCKGYPNEIVQLLINIINNAKEAFLINQTKDKKVDICAYIEDVPTIHIKNNGGNIDANHIKRIFEPNYSTKESNSGLGLYMCNMIAQKNNAILSVENTLNVEDGSTGVIFYIRFHSVK